LCCAGETSVLVQGDRKLEKAQVVHVAKCNAY
jgi:hypothetical protein